MKILVFLSFVIFGGCSSWDSGKCFISAKKAFPKCEITVIPGLNYSFLVRDSLGNVMKVGNYSIVSTEVTSIDTFFYAKSNNNSCE